MNRAQITRMKHVFFHRHTAIIISSYVLLALFLMSFDPYSLPVLLLLIPFVLFFIGSFLLLYRLLLYLSIKLKTSFKAARCARIAFATSGAPTFLVLLQSIGQVGLYEIIVTVILFVGADFYLARSKIGVFKNGS